MGGNAGRRVRGFLAVLVLLCSGGEVAFCRDLFAVVDQNGIIVRGDAVGVSARSGRYEVSFATPVSGCSYTATIGDPANGLVYNPGLVFTASGHGGANGVYIETKNPGGGLAGYPFHLSANCTSDYAVVDANGQLVRGDAQNVTHDAPGVYEVSFPKPGVAGCSYTATIGDPANGLDQMFA